MSPIRRFWVAWFGGKLMPFFLGFHFLIVILVLIMQKEAERQLTGKNHLLLLTVCWCCFILLPQHLGIRFQALVCSENLVFSQLHVRWVLRSFFIGLLPATIVSILGTLLLCGFPFWWSCGFAFICSIVGFWSGYAKSPFIIFWFLLFGMLYLNDWLLPTKMPVMVGVLAIILSSIGVCIAWKRIDHRHCQEPKQSVSFLSSMWESFDRQFPSTSTPKTQTGRFPSLWTPVRLGFRQFPKHGIIVFPLVTTFFTLMQLMGYPQITFFLSSVVIFVSAWCGLLPFFSLSKGANGQGLSLALAGYFANERLRPWSRQQSSIASFLFIVSHGLVVPFAWVGGIVFGSILSACISGDSSIALQSWWFLPLVLIVTLGSAALYVIGMSFHRWGAYLSGAIIGVFYPIMFVCLYLHLADFLIFLGVIFILTLTLVPLTWYRLARAELP